MFVLTIQLRDEEYIQILINYIITTPLKVNFIWLISIVNDQDNHMTVTDLIG